MEIRKISFKNSKETWNSLYNSNGSISPYMSYEFQRIYKQNLWAGEKRLGAKYEVYMAIDDQKELCVIPMIKKGIYYYIAGDLCATGALDFIYDSNLCVEYMLAILNELRKTLNGKIILNKIPEETVLGHALLLSDYKKETCVSIKFPSDYEDYFKSLSKSVRQNIRTAKNRMNRENKKYEFSVRMGGIERDTNKEIMLLYNQRSAERQNRKIHPIIRFVRENFNPITKCSLELDNAFLSMIFIDDVLAGFMSGFLTSDGKKCIVPRLAINSNYGVYCPGSLLISDTIDYFIQETDVRILDLSRGDEKYKYSMGGEEHYNLTVLLE